MLAEERPKVLCLDFGVLEQGTGVAHGASGTSDRTRNAD